LHPALAEGGEVHLCPDAYHLPDPLKEFQTFIELLEEEGVL
jgi:hypothetical protein